MEWRTEKDEDFGIIADWVLNKVKGSCGSDGVCVFDPDKSIKHIVLLYGDLGAGKTTFTKQLAKKLNIQEEIISPTFVIQKSFFLQDKVGPLNKLIHIDAYRFEDPKEGEGIKLKESLEDERNLIVIEWPEKLDQELLKQFESSTIKIQFEHDGEGRIIREI